MTDATKRRILSRTLAAFLLAGGCHVDQQPEIDYLGEQQRQSYKSEATEIDYPTNATDPTPGVVDSFKPHTIRDRDHTEIRDFSLAEAIQTALMNSDVIRQAATFQTIQNPLFTNPNGVSSVYDSAIQESGVLFGQRGVEAALADFDAQFTSTITGGQNDYWTNNTSTGLLNTTTGSAQSSLTKVFANGGQVTINNDIEYLRSNQPLQYFNSTYAGYLSFNYRQPLLAGAGTQFTRVAGPIAKSFGGISGVSQGVLVARINNDLVLSDFEFATRNLMLDVEYAYWDLYFAYRNFDTAVVNRNSALETWRLTKRQAGEVVIPAEEAQARNSYYAARSLAEAAQSQIFTNETKLRRLLAMPINDGTTLRPIDEPVTAEIVPDWTMCMSDALSKRVELRRQKWNIKSLELQLEAARSLTKARLDLVSGYQLNAFGDNFLNGNNGGSPPPDGYLNSLFSGNQTGWTTGVQMSIPIGFRQAWAQVRNYELRVSKAHKVLAAQELEVGHELAAAFQDLDRYYGTMRSNYLRYMAAEDDVRLREPRYRAGEELVDAILRAYDRRALAEITYYQSVVDYNRSIANLELRRGTLLQYNNVQLMEGYWRPEAYGDAQRQACARNFAHEDPTSYDSTEPFASSTPVYEYSVNPPTTASESYSPPAASGPPSEPQPATDASADEPVPTPAP